MPGAPGRRGHGATSTPGPRARRSSPARSGLRALDPGGCSRLRVGVGDLRAGGDGPVGERVALRARVGADGEAARGRNDGRDDGLGDAGVLGFAHGAVSFFASGGLGSGRSMAAKSFFVSSSISGGGGAT